MLIAPHRLAGRSGPTSRHRRVGRGAEAIHGDTSSIDLTFPLGKK